MALSAGNSPVTGEPYVTEVLWVKKPKTFIIVPYDFHGINTHSTVGYRYQAARYHMVSYLTCKQKDGCGIYIRLSTHNHGTMAEGNGLSPGRRQTIIWTIICWNIVKSNLRYQLKWSRKWNPYIFIQENAFEHIVCKMPAILSRPHYVKYSNKRIVNITSKHTGSLYLRQFCIARNHVVASAQTLHIYIIQ